MGDVSNLKQVLSNTQAVERLQKIQERADQSGQQQFTRHLQEEADKRTRSVNDRAEIKRPDDEEERVEERKEKRKRARSEGRDGDDAANDGDDSGEASDEDETHVDVVV